MDNILMCTRCGRTYADGESPLYEYDHAENGRVYRTGYATCHCGGDLTDAVECQFCGEIIPVEERKRGNNMESLCPVCFEDHAEHPQEPRKSA